MPSSPEKISGVVSGANGKPFQNATVELTVNDSLVRSMTTSDDGTYLFENLAYGTYKLMVSAIGYKTYDSARISLSADEPFRKINLVLRDRSAKELTEVSVTGQKRFVEDKIDRTL